MAAATQRIGRLKRIDRAAVFIITLGGIAVVVGVLGILVFIASGSLPLFRSAHADAEAAPSTLAGRSRRPTASCARVGVDEYRKYLFTVEPDARVVFYRARTGRASRSEFPFPGLGAGTRVTSSSRSLARTTSSRRALSDGRVALVQVLFTPQYESQTLSGLDVRRARPRPRRRSIAAQRPVRQVSYIEQDGAAVRRRPSSATTRSRTGGRTRTAASIARTLRVAGRPASSTHVRVGRNGAIMAGTDRGRVYHWDLRRRRAAG